MGDEDCFEGLYHYLKVLGEGSFGKAVLYRRYTDNFLVVWKEVSLPSCLDIFSERLQGSRLEYQFILAIITQFMPRNPQF